LRVVSIVFPPINHSLTEAPLAWGKDEPGTQYGFEPEVGMCFSLLSILLTVVVVQIQHVYFSGFKNKDVAFFHADSKTLITADLIFNLPGKEQYSTTKTWLPLFGLGLNPSSFFHRFMIKGLGKDVECVYNT
jgi:hypothetical protein